MEVTPSSASLDVGTLLGYRGEDVEAFLARARAERAAAASALAAARVHLDELRAQLAVTTELRDRLGDLVVDAQRAAKARRAELDEAVATIAQRAEAEAARILAAARAEAAALHPGTTPQHDPSVGEGGTLDLSNGRLNGVG
jgi:cell division septum initiation protein DivIVA